MESDYRQKDGGKYKMAAYNELIKNFERTRAYMKDFYIYGFKSRKEYDKKSLRTYDNEKRRLESWLGEYISFLHTVEGKAYFLSIDSREISHNPLYRAWKAKSFTDGDITLHFILFDILYSSRVALSLSEILDWMDQYYFSYFRDPMVFDESTVRKKLNEYIKEGLIVSEKQGKKLVYRRAPAPKLPPLTDALDFYSEIAPCGVIGSFLLDKEPKHESPFSFKHHYITDALDSDILATLFSSMREKRSVSFGSMNVHGGEGLRFHVVPLRVFIGVQNGRQHLLCYRYDIGRICPFRIDYIVDVRPEQEEPRFDHLRKMLEQKMSHMWGVNLYRLNEREKIEHVEFVVRVAPDEDFIVHRLHREKRVGRVERIGEGLYRFSADVYDTTEMVPWIRTFLCRIVSLSFSNQQVEARFREDLAEMYRMYEIDGGAV